MEKLLFDLNEAAQILSQYRGGYSGVYLSAEEFHTSLVERIKKLENGDRSVMDSLWVDFAPTCAWDDFVGNVEMGNRVFERLDKLNKNSLT